MKRTRVTILCVIIFSVLYNSPHMVTSSNQGWQCLPYGEESVMSEKYGTLYYWLSFILHYALPFVLLLSMNCVIIHTIRSSAKFRTKLDRVPDNNSEGQGQSQGHLPKTKSSENQVYIVLLLVAFGFLILTTPGYLLFLFIMVVDFETSAKVYAGFYLFFNVAQKLHYTNHGINFFLYVMSGQKFRKDLMKLFKVNDFTHKETTSGDTVISTVCDSKTTKVTWSTIVCNLEKIIPNIWPLSAPGAHAPVQFHSFSCSLQENKLNSWSLIFEVGGLSRPLGNLGSATADRSLELHSLWDSMSIRSRDVCIFHQQNLLWLVWNYWGISKCFVSFHSFMHQALASTHR